LLVSYKLPARLKCLHDACALFDVTAIIMVRVHVLLSFVAAFHSGIAHCLPFEEDDFFDPFGLEAGLWGDTASYPTADTLELVDFSFHDDLNNPLFLTSSEPTSASQCVEDEYPTESLNKARSLDRDQLFDIAGGGYCLQDPSEEEQEAPIELHIPDLNNLFNLLHTPDPEREAPPWSGYWTCAAGNRILLVCCEKELQWDSNRDDCTMCMFRSANWFFRVFHTLQSFWDRG
jgi:hypothetical protein